MNSSSSGVNQKLQGNPKDNTWLKIKTDIFQGAREGFGKTKRHLGVFFSTCLNSIAEMALRK